MGIHRDEEMAGRSGAGGKRFEYIRQKGTSDDGDPGEIEASKLRQTMIRRIVGIDAIFDKVGNIGGLRKCLSWEAGEAKLEVDTARVSPVSAKPPPSPPPSYSRGRVVG